MMKRVIIATGLATSVLLSGFTVPAIATADDGGTSGNFTSNPPKLPKHFPHLSPNNPIYDPNDLPSQDHQPASGD